MISYLSPADRDPALATRRWAQTARDASRPFPWGDVLAAVFAVGVAAWCLIRVIGG